MNHDQDLLSRLVDFHDHISVPPVPVTDDLHRGQRRVRRNRGLLAGGATVGVACAVVGASLVIGGGSAERQQPVGPPTTDATSESVLDHRGLTAPLVAPESILDVSELGFHVEPVPGFDPVGLEGGWSIDDDGQTIALRWDEVADDVVVTVGYQGVSADVAFSPYGVSRGEDVAIHGVPGRYYEEPEGARGITGTFAAHLVWEYAPDSWASVSTGSDRGDPGPERLRSALIEVAEAVAPDGEAVRLPFRVGEVPSSLPKPATADEVGIRHGTNGVAAYLQVDNVQVEVNGGSHWSEDPFECEPNSEVGAEPFTLGGNSGCLFGYGTTDEPPAGTSFNSVAEIWLQVNGTPRFIRPGFPDGAGPVYPVADLKQVLANLTVATLDDTLTWYDLRTALDD